MLERTVSDGVLEFGLGWMMTYEGQNVVMELGAAHDANSPLSHCEPLPFNERLIKLLEDDPQKTQRDFLQFVVHRYREKEKIWGPFVVSTAVIALIGGIIEMRFEIGFEGLAKKSLCHWRKDVLLGQAEHKRSFFSELDDRLCKLAHRFYQRLDHVTGKHSDYAIWGKPRPLLANDGIVHRAALLSKFGGMTSFEVRTMCQRFVAKEDGGSPLFVRYNDDKVVNCIECLAAV